MKKVLLILLAITSLLNAQSFTNITEGEIVNDGGYSFGASWGDFNNDGFPDLYVSNGGADGRNEANFLYMNNGDGTFEKISTGDIVALAQKSIGSTIVDFDNDNDLDIFIANRNGDNNALFQNNGDNTFTRIVGSSIVTSGGNTNGSSWTDINLDGYPDLFAANFFEQPFLYINKQDGTFELFNNGPPVSGSSNSISAVWSDFDNDRDPDLFIANAAAGGILNLFYINNGDNSFTKMNSGAVTSDKKASMGGTWGDFNNDGNLDLFVANQDVFENDLYINAGDGELIPLQGTPVVTEISLSINGNFADVDNDGDLDLYVTNWQNNFNFLYINSGYPDYNLEKISDNTIVNDALNSMGSAWADYDNDGDLDLFVANRNNQNNQLFRNETSQNNWVTFIAVGTASGKSALVSKFRILAEINGQKIWQMREINAQQGYNSQDDMRIHFGLGNADIVDSLIVEWSSGKKERYSDISINQFHTIIEGEGTVGISSADEKLLNNRFSLSQNYPNPFNPTTNIKFTIPLIGINETESSNVRLIVYNALGEEVAELLNDINKSGDFEVTFNAAGLPSGVYFYRLTNGQHSEFQKMILLK